MKSFLAISLIIIPLVVNSQSVYDSTRLSPLIKKIVYEIDSRTKGNWDYHEDFSSQFKLLRQRVKINELLQLVNHPSPFVRINAFNLLLDSAYTRFVDILEDHINDTVAVYLWSGHDAEPTNVIGGMIYLLSWNNNWMRMKEFPESDQKRMWNLIEQYSQRKKKN